MSTGRFVLRTMFSAHTSCMGVLPNPVPAKIAARPLRNAHSTRCFWKSKRKSGIHSGAKPWRSPDCDFCAMNSAYVSIRGLHLTLRRPPLADPIECAAHPAGAVLSCAGLRDEPRENQRVARDVAD